MPPPPPPTPDSDLAAAQAGGNSSSDFVRKLFKMLEDPTYSSVVRWSNEGDSFIVLENEKFTKTILPKHFKHSNFASFVRQLNKYDFHKVRQSEENGDGTYGKNAWEFKHPDFRADRKDNLDTIRRKAPAPRKAPQVEENYSPAQQQVMLLNEQLVATQHQVQALEERYFQLAEANKILVNEVVSLQKLTKSQSQVSTEIISHLGNMDDRRRSSRHSAHSNHSAHSAPAYQSPSMGMLPDSADEPAPELRRAREILNAMSPDVVADRELERLSVAYHQMGSPPDSTTSSVMFTHHTPVPPLIQDPMSDMRHLVYPVGQNAGIDPFHSDHIQNIPYPRPVSTSGAVGDGPAQTTPPPGKDTGGSLWGQRKPCILLVEDDKTCSRIGTKFLSHADCTVDCAADGGEAVNKVNNQPDKYDLIFMDIIMPVFDGVSATACIRVVAPRVPIVAMTSNIRQEDINTYFQWGMNDVLAKPFTREGMLRILRKHLSHLLKNPPPLGPPGGEMAAPNGGGPSGHPDVQGYSLGAHPVTSAGPPVKFETTPLQSPSTTASWHSPSQATHTSPHMDGGGYMTAPGSGGGMVLTPGGTQRPHHFPNTVVPQMGNPPMARMPDGLLHGDGPPEKRPRIYGPGQGAYS